MQTGTYNFWLLMVSFPVAMLASYTALDITGRIASAKDWAALRWLAGGALAVGSGLWSMHMIGMLAWRLSVPVGYDPGLIAASWLVAVFASAIALQAAAGQAMTALRFAVGALVLGCGICFMHWIALGSIHMSPAIHQRAVLMLTSGVMATAASTALLFLGHYLKDRCSRTRMLRCRAAIVVGCAFAAASCASIGSAEVATGSVCRSLHSPVQFLWLGALVMVSTVIGLAVAVVTFTVDVRLESHTAALAASLADANQELTYLALHDSLTKLPNRLLLEDRLNQAIQVARRTTTIFSVMFLDLDGFKEVNDVFGHHIGDTLLSEVALRVRNVIRASDTLARIGGDEFVLLADLADPTSAANLADKLVRVIGQPYRISGQELRISVSIGIALYEESAQDAHDLLRNADAAMYHAKVLGRSGYCFFEPSMNADAHEQLQLLQELRSAMTRNEMVLHYQPKFDAASARLAGVEALVRWQHPVRGLLSPDQFIPLAEKSGVILQLGEWVLNEACRQMGEWHEQGHRGWTVAVNLSALQFGHAGLLGMIRDTLDRYHLEPGCLTLEITETTAMQNPHVSMAILQKLNDMGVKISIDDFGTGYSSLLYLKRLPAAELKIDRGFVRDLAPHTEDAAIVSAIVALGRILNLNIVAEGIETKAQQEFLTGIGCSTLQGFLLGRPMPAAELVAALSASEAAREAAAHHATRRAGQKVVTMQIVPHTP